jgi:hypothetical protein
MTLLGAPNESGFQMGASSTTQPSTMDLSLGMFVLARLLFVGYAK